ncbi:hypothetical protein Q3G72_030114 [Acer saccharum]|nr:hypothetical protein Q3G72_030114 [Acer saccharum]
MEAATVDPPLIKNKPGRPKLVRKRELHEKPKASRSGSVICTKCRNPGHNKRICKAVITSESNKKDCKRCEQVVNQCTSRSWCLLFTASHTVLTFYFSTVCLSLASTSAPTVDAGRSPPLPSPPPPPSLEDTADELADNIVEFVTSLPKSVRQTEEERIPSISK